MKVMVRVENLGKQYQIAETLTEASTSRRRYSFSRRFKRESCSCLWALRNVGFEIGQGEAVGILGRNGAGKSTLLKILSRITAPTTGRLRLRGRVASLLEVGTGFHPDFTGRENVFFSGVLMGLSKAEVARYLDEIVAFAEIEKFLDTPVKRYSSGMYMRLAFAVAAHLEPEIWVLDEVLAVGDTAFSQKCLAKMSSVREQGATVLFVSHNLSAVSNVCQRALWLEQGELKMSGSARDVIDAYTGDLGQNCAQQCWPSPAEAPGSDKVRLHAVRLLSGGQVQDVLSPNQSVQVEIEYWTLRDGMKISVGIHLKESSGVEVLASANLPSLCIERDEWFGRAQPAGLYRAICTLPAHFLNERRYSISVMIVSEMTCPEVSVHDVLTFDVNDTNLHKEYSGTLMGAVRPRLDWKTQRLSPRDAA